MKHTSRLLKNTHLRRYPHPSSLRRTTVYVSFLGISGALHLRIFYQPASKRLYQYHASDFVVLMEFMVCIIGVV
jgi:hypothetical protein